MPNRVELFRSMDESIYTNMKSKTKVNIFKDYLAYLKESDLLSEEQKEIMDSRAYDFIKMIENTAMNKSYKIPVLLAFYNSGKVKTEINDDDIYESFKDFYTKGSNKVDMLKDKSSKDFEKWGKKEYVSLAKRNPIKAFCENKDMFFEINEEGNMIIKGIDSFKENKEFIKQMKDAIELRVEQYYEEKFNKK